MVHTLGKQKLSTPPTPPTDDINLKICRPTPEAAKQQSASLSLTFFRFKGQQTVSVWFDVEKLKRLLAHVAGIISSLYILPQLCNTYLNIPLSADTEKLLHNAGRKTLILDLDETLVHSNCKNVDYFDIHRCHAAVPPNAKPDFSFTVNVDGMVLPFDVYKRPYVDLFLDFVSKWYDTVIYTASLEIYASNVLDRLDAGRGILRQRYFRQHCTQVQNNHVKNLTMINSNLNQIMILDNSPHAYQNFPDNAIPISSFYYDTADTELLKVLPLLDALRFTKNVRSVLGRRLH